MCHNGRLHVSPWKRLFRRKVSGRIIWNVKTTKTRHPLPDEIGHLTSPYTKNWELSRPKLKKLTVGVDIQNEHQRPNDHKAKSSLPCQLVL